MPIELRPHQVDAVNALFDYFDKAAGNPLCVIPCGGGKSLTMAAFCRRAIESFPETRILIATHRAELIKQDSEAIRALWPEADVGVYSAGLGMRQIRRITVAGVQSIVNVDSLPPFSLLLVDEAHLIPKEGDGQYRTLIARLTTTNPDLKIVGFTATPFRYSGGRLTRGKGKVFSSICYDLPIQKLVDDGFLVPLVTPANGTNAAPLSTVGVGTSAGDYKSGELARKVEDQDNVTRAALEEAGRLATSRQSWLVFCVSIEHARQAASHLFAMGINAHVVTGEDDMGARSMKIEAFKRREIRALVSVDVLNVGFDAPCADCIVMLRPTKSTGLFIQTAGRAMRLYPGKKDALFLDYANCIAEHGPITAVNPKEAKEAVAPKCKVCPKCDAEVPQHRIECPECGFVFPRVPRAIEHDKRAATSAIMGPPPPPEWIEVTETTYDVWHKKPEPDKPAPPPTMRARYFTGNLAKRDYAEWLCFEHGGFATEKAWRWWAKRGGLLPAPRTCEEAVERAYSELRPVEAIIAEKDGQWWRVKDARLGAMREPGADDDVEDDGEIEDEPDNMGMEASDFGLPDDGEEIPF